MERDLYGAPVAVEAPKKRAGLGNASIGNRGADGLAIERRSGAMNDCRRFLAGVAGLTLVMFSAGAAAATECTGPDPLSGTIVGGVVVNDGDFCILGGANVSGGVQVNEGGILIVCSSTINGGIVSNGAANLIIGAGADEEVPPANFVCPGNIINGGIAINNTGEGALAPAPSIAIERDRINGSVYLSGNLGAIVVANDTISGGLFCAGNASDLDDEETPSVIRGPVHCKFGN